MDSLLQNIIKKRKQVDSMANEKYQKDIEKKLERIQKDTIIQNNILQNMKYEKYKSN